MIPRATLRRFRGMPGTAFIKRHVRRAQRRWLKAELRERLS